MTIITKDDRRLYPVLFGSYKTPEYSEYITCVNEADMNNENPKKIRVHISEIKAIQGTYSFPLFYAKQTTKADDPERDQT
jgi:hypothetical protein